jgi:hypothetical protein
MVLAARHADSVVRGHLATQGHDLGYRAHGMEGPGGAVLIIPAVALVVVVVVARVTLP